MQIIRNKRKLTVGFQWHPKPRRVWLELPFVTLFFEPGMTCPNCKGAGQFHIEAGDGQWSDDCETCNGTGRIRE